MSAVVCNSAKELTVTTITSPDLPSASLAPTINYRLPQIEQLLQHSDLADYVRLLSRPVVTNTLRQLFASIRQHPDFKTQGVNDLDIMALVLDSCRQLYRRRQQRVINATGIAVHTNLGRSPINEQIWDSVKAVNTGYNNLELKLSDGKRGDRNGLLPTLIQSWIGAEDCVVVNNNAASVYLVLHALAAGKEVIVSRGEQVQIGGGFRIPDILALSGCKLVEVGTTNITTSDDYINAITENTAMVLMVHQSNFSMQGFTESPDIQDVAERLPEHVSLVIDQGSGLSSEQYAQSEVSLPRYLQMGVDLVCFSGDKIIGGPQAGIIAGCSKLCQQLAKNPMMRTFRSGRIVLSMLEQLLVQKLNRDPAAFGVAQQALDRAKVSQSLAQQWALRWKSYAQAVPLVMQVGGGAIPSETYPCYGLKLTLPGKAQAHLDALRDLPTPIIGYVNSNQLLLNVATLLDSDHAVFIAQLDDYIQSYTNGEAK